jgi:BlaI family penicillinase repressor
LFIYKGGPMARRKTRVFTEVELEFMQVLWAYGESTPDDIQTAMRENGRTLTGGSIRNVLAIMIEKGYVTRRKKGKTFLYRAKVHEDQAARSMVMDLLTRAFGGSESQMVAALLKNRDIHKKELSKIERIIFERKRGEKP